MICANMTEAEVVPEEPTQQKNVSMKKQMTNTDKVHVKPWLGLKLIL